MRKRSSRRPAPDLERQRAEAAALAAHRAHDYRDVVRRWRALVRRANMRMEKVGAAGGFDIFGIKTRALRDGGRSGWYLSAGVHGDEPAAVAGLLAWAEGDPEFLRDEPALVFPCLNPFGLVHNTRADHRGKDLNRRFDSRHDAQIRAWRRFVGTSRFHFGLALHEDYDACGVYAYELAPDGDDPIAPDCLAAVTDTIPAEPRREVDGRPARDGLVSTDPKHIPKPPGLPESLELIRTRTVARSITFETPSEFSFYARTEAHRKFIAAAAERLKAES